MHSFRTPVRVRIASHQNDVEIGTVAEALRFLEAWPSQRRGPVHRCALGACRACLEGTMPVDDARRAFDSFVRITGLSPPVRTSPPPPRSGSGNRPLAS